ncbi:hypothetical protein PIIN_11353 [Serendipita indica DSM 11827]|uniref:C2H2-type domain-containing protein n=1 Tax=Serendipita indica (strain DSM 11827) TaxID=1109443 RepID=G4U1D3_SERID|nr:hypothetical protein PIIN_11353 [Serendipita indica DSM 11827]
MFQQSEAFLDIVDEHEYDHPRCLGRMLLARTRDLDQIQLHDLRPAIRAALEHQPLDSEKPGLAQHYCVECARYFESDVALRSHWRTKLHKRRLKRLQEPAYTIEEAERAAGLGRELRTSTVSTAA